jgi:hypothetical protein
LSRAKHMKMQGNSTKENSTREGNAVFRKLQPTFGSSEAAV